MATRATIAAVTNDGSVIKVYSHYDGYIQGGAGEGLFKYFTTLDSIEDLISGEIRQLGYDGFVNYFEDGEGDIEIFKDFEDYISNCYFHSYNYLFKDGEWFVDGEKLKTYFIEDLV